jgi:hypothetical protein
MMNTDRGEPDKFVVPFEAQVWMMQALGDKMLNQLHQVIYQHAERIRLLMDERSVDGYTHFGSEMYNWGAENRLANILEELADAAVYMTSGPLPQLEEKP